MATYNFYVSGIHCQSCKVLIEDVINKQPGVSQASVNIFTQCLTVTGKFTYSPEAIITTWSKILSPHNYTLSLDKPLPARDLKSTVYALPIGLFFLALFIPIPNCIGVWFVAIIISFSSVPAEGDFLYSSFRPRFPFVEIGLKCNGKNAGKVR